MINIHTLMAPRWFTTTNKVFKSSLPRRLFPHLRTNGTRPPMSPSSLRDEPRVHPLHQTFLRLDSNGDGKISSHELRAFFVSMGDSMSDDEAEGVISDHDSNGDDLLDFGDFVRLVDKDGGEDDLRRAFEMFEVERGSGYITPRGVQRMLSRLGEEKSDEECKTMIRAFDLDGNGVLDFDEFLRMMS